MEIETISLAAKYLAFVRLGNALQEKHALTAPRSALLRLLTNAYLEKSPLKVVDAMQHKELASPATIHKLIHELVEHKFIQYEVDPSDHRVRYLIPTPASIRLFAALGKEMG